MTLTLAQLQKLDLTALVSSELFDMDVRCDRAHLYKYLSFPDPAVRQSYFAKPTVKFATKAQLNDTFDLSRRFEHFGSEPVRAFFVKHVTEGLAQRLTDLDYLIEVMAKDVRFVASGLNKSQLRQLLSSPVGQAYIAAARENVQRQLPELVDLLFNDADSRVDQLLEHAVSGTGVLSLTELYDNRALWSVYADAGRGFVFEFNAQHDFFLASQKDGSKRNRLMRVFYRDDRLPDFWTNPYYLFGVKHLEFEFEREWRAIRSLKDCNDLTLGTGETIYILDAPLGLISSVIFGYRWKDEDMQREGAILKAFDPSLRLKQAIPDNGGFAIHSLD